MLDHSVRVFVLETGEQFPLDSLASVMRRAVDSDTADRMEDAGVNLKDFSNVEEFIKKRDSRLRSRVGGAGTGKGPDAMVYGVAAAEAAAAAPPGTAATAPESPLLDSWAGSAANPWSGAAQQPQTQAVQPPHQPEPDPESLDAFGKGKGKGSSDQGPLHFYN